MKVRIYKLFAWVVLSAFFSVPAWCTQIIGAEITYSYVSGTTYKINVKMYRDCNGVPPSNSPVKISWSTNSMNVTLPEIYHKDITNIPAHCSMQSRCTGSYQYGIEEWLYSGDVTLPADSSVCQYLLSWEQSARNSAITTGGAGQNFYIEATLDKCLTVKNSTPVFTQTPQILLPVGQDIALSYSAYDSIDHDIVKFTLVDPLSAHGVPISYGGGWSAQKPVSFLGFPNANSSCPSGFRIDSNGVLNFRPTVQNQISIIVVEVSEWRYISGVLTQISATRRDMQVIIIPSPNNYAPKFSQACSRQPTLNACANGSQVCVDISVTDQNSGDSLSYSYKSNVKNITFTNTSSAYNKGVIHVCYTPDSTEIAGNNNYFFSIRALDDACPLSGIADISYYIKLNKLPDTTYFGIGQKTVKCNTLFAKVNKKLPYDGDLTFTWKNDDGGLTTGDSAQLVFKNAGWQKYTITAKSAAAACTYTITDSVLINPLYTLNSATKNDSLVCFTDSVTLFTYPLNGYAPYTYKWFSLADNPTVKVAAFASQKYYSRIVDSNYCANFDSVSITVPGTLPQVDAGTAKTVCPQVPITLSAIALSGFAPFKYEWIGIDTLRVVSTLAPLNNKTYKVKITDKFGCFGYDSVEVKELPVKIKGSPDTTVCFGGTANLSVVVEKGKPPYTYNWLGTGNNTPGISVTPPKDTLYVLRFSDSSCTLYDTIRVGVNQSVSVTAQNDTGACEGNVVPITLRVNSYTATAPVTFTWNGVAGGSTYNTLTDKSKNIIVGISDKYNCKAYDTIFVEAYVHPKPFSYDAKVCPGLPVLVRTISIGGKAPFSYAWSNGATTDTFTYLANSKMVFTVTSTDAHGCSGTGSTLVDVYPRDKLVKNPVATQCETGNPLQLQAFPQAGTWTGAGVNGSKFYPQVAGPGIHAVLYTFTGYYGCQTVDTTLVTVISAPPASFTVDKDSGIAPLTVNFTNTTTTTTNKWFWDFDNPKVYHWDISMDENPTFTFKWPGVFNVEFTGSLDGCSGKATKTIRVYQNKVSTDVNSVTNINVNVYPNPSEEYVYIESPDEIIAVTIFDISGKKVSEIQNINAQKAEINTSALSAGIYVINISTRSLYSINKKLIVK